MKTSYYLENYSFKNALPINITANQVINAPMKNLILTSGTIARIINPIIISMIPIILVINFLFFHSINKIDEIHIFCK